MRISDWSSDVCSSDLDLAAERRGREADRRAREQSRALALENPVPRHVQEDTEVARRRPARPALALARQADERALVDAGGDVDGQSLAPVDEVLAGACVARVGAAPARAPATSARSPDP